MSNKQTKFFYSEIFGDTIQGEGQYTGVPTAWIRFYLCNLSCTGFGQSTPSKPETWKPVISDTINVLDITDIKDLPVFEYGCDSAYSVAKRFKHLQKHESVEEIVDKIAALLPDGKFVHPKTNQPIHFAFTGGEPMLNQPAMIAILNEFKRRDMQLKYITVETNGTRKLSQELKECLIEHIENNGLEVLWSVSPKLLHTAGEQRKKAIKVEHFSEYVHSITKQLFENEMLNGWAITRRVKMQVKFVANGTQETWDEIEEVLEICKPYGIHYVKDQISVWVMPAGGSLEGQLGQIEGHMHAGVIADEAIKRGYNVAARVHNYLWANVVGK